MTRFTTLTALAITSVALAAPIAHAGSAAPLTTAETARLGAQTEAAGFENIDRYQKQQYAEQLVQAGAHTEAVGFENIDRYLKQQYGTHMSTTSSVNGFQWADAGIGAAVTAGLAFLALAGALVIRGRRHPSTGLPV